MPGKPRRGEVYRQEYYPRFALDQAKVLGSGGRVTVPNGTYKRTPDRGDRPSWTPVAERKYYVAGLGDIKEHTTTGNHEQIKLVSVTH